jgi:hypothetical protein
MPGEYKLRNNCRPGVTVLAAMTIFYGCATSRGSSPKPAPAAAQSQGHIYVTSESLGRDCYQDLGQLTLNESFAQSIIDSGDSQTEQLRSLAREKYPQADAVINVREQQNEAGTDVEIIGEAVRVQNHETIECATRAMPGVVDSASAAAAGGMFGTVVGGLASSSPDYAEGGGWLGATAVAGYEIAKHRKQQHVEEAFISDRLAQQQNEIAQLRQQLAKVMEQQCDSEQVSEQDCNQRISAAQQQIAKATETDESAPVSASPPEAGAASTGATSDFQIRNRMQEQQETIDQLQRRIAQIKRSLDNQ